MPNLASILKSEIARVARRELRSEIEPLKKSGARYRAEIAALKRQVSELERQLAQGQRAARSSSSSNLAGGAPVSDVRFRADGIKPLLTRLGLSAADLGEILGVSVQTVYNWSNKNSRPPKDQVAKISVLRKMGKREVQVRLAQQRGAAGCNDFGIP